MITVKPGSFRVPVKMTVAVLVKAAVAEELTTGVMAKLVGALGGVVTITQDVDSLPLPRLPARSLIPAASTVKT